MKLEQAEAIAEEIVRLLDNTLPSPRRLLIVGSIRRRCADVGDIDIVIEATEEQREKVRWAVDFQPGFKKITDGNDIVRFTKLGPPCAHLDIDVDLYFTRPATATTPANWGSIVVCRTGSREFNKWLCNLANKDDKHWNPQEGVYRMKHAANCDKIHCGQGCAGDLLASATEEDIFKALRIPFPKPEERV